MRLLIQRVKKAEVLTEEGIVGSIEKGLLVLLGIHKKDTKSLIDPMVSKLIHLRIFADEGGKMNLSVLDVQGSILVVSQFTLYGNCSRGRRPEFLESAPGPIAEPLYEQFVSSLQTYPVKVATGRFGAHMEVSLINDGPVTLLLES